MGWRDQKVHPAADVFPMMSDEELAELGEDIKEKGLLAPVVFWEDDDGNEFLLDGRNRLEAMDRAGVEFNLHADATYDCTDPVAYVISANIHRRHLTKQKRADLIVAAIKAGEKPRQLDEVSKGGRGRVNPVKAKAVEIAEKAANSAAGSLRSQRNPSNKSLLGSMPLGLTGCLCLEELAHV
jgi:ParB-like chromosome segregation protein Spo0J